MFEKFFNGGARERMERKLVSTVDLDRILNHFGELPRLSELSQDRQKKWRERNLLMRQIIERCRQDTVKSAMKDSWKEWHEDPGVMQELSELLQLSREAF